MSKVDRNQMKQKMTNNKMKQKMRRRKFEKWQNRILLLACHVYAGNRVCFNFSLHTNDKPTCQDTNDAKIHTYIPLPFYLDNRHQWWWRIWWKRHSDRIGVPKTSFHRPSRRPWAIVQCRHPWHPFVGDEVVENLLRLPWWLLIDWSCY